MASPAKVEAEEAVTKVEHDDHAHGIAGSSALKGLDLDGARAANEEEHSLTTRRALRVHWKAVMWSLIVSMSIIMEGYDTSLIFNFFGYPAFQRQFGQEYADGDWQVPGPWQSALGSVNTAGCIIGAFINGWAIKMFGFRLTFMVGLGFMCGFIFISFFGDTVELQMVGQLMCGIPWGVFATIGPAYASELLPLALRPYLTAYTNMCFAIGQFIAAGVVQSMNSRTDQWSYRIPFAIQWIWPAPLIVIAWFMPESPWWLVRNGRHEDAEKTLLRLGSNVDHASVRRKVAMMIHTNEIEMQNVKGSSYVDCYRGTNARRTEIACMSFAGQVLTGSAFAYSATYFFQQAGLSQEDSYSVGLGGTGIAFLGTIISWFLMRAFGRRLLYLSGTAVMALMLFIIGILTIWASSNAAIGWVQSALCIIWLFAFSMTIGPVGWTIPAEVSSTRLRSKTIVLARNTYYICNIIANVIEPYFMNPQELNWRGYTGFFWCGFALVTLVWSFFRLPETKGRTFEELDIMFSQRVRTRKFATHVVDAYADDLGVNQRTNAMATNTLREEKV